MTTDPFPDVPDPEFDDLPRKTRGLDRHANYEDKAVRKLCTQLGHPGLVRAIINECRDRTGTPVATFAMLDEITRFPVRLRTGNLRRVRFITLPDLFDRVHRTPIGFALQDVCDEVDPDDGPIGLVFKWAGVKDADGKSHAIKGGEFMVAHTGPTNVTPGSVMIVASLKLCGVMQTVTIQKFQDFLETYRGWSPN